MRVLFLLGDQLDPAYPDHLGLERGRDVIVMMEVGEASTRPASHVQRTVLFLSAMRHHAAALRDAGWTVDYRRLTDADHTHSFAGEARAALARHAPAAALCLRPGDHAVLEALDGACDEAGVALEVHEEPHFISTVEDFEMWASGRRELVMEYFYREQRRRTGYLMQEDGTPVGGAWNFDRENRKPFRRRPDLPPRPVFEPDDITRAVIADVQRVLPDLPGRLDAFNWPVTRAQALEALAHFIEHHLASFGDHQDAMWTGEHVLHHSLLSPALNLKLLNPREVCDAAVRAHEQGEAPLNAVEGFVRQIIGWREFIRGVYHTQPPDYARRNELGHENDLPPMYWTGETDMACMRHALESVLELGYGHHIARLMITGNFALIAGVEPRQVNDWYRGMYVDAVDWVTTPNTVGMALFADGGVVGTKPYAASGSYVKRMSNYCKGCRYDVTRRSGDDACPFNTFYWDFLIRHRRRFASNRRMTMILRHVEKMSEQERTEITISAARRREALSM